MATGIEQKGGPAVRPVGAARPAGPEGSAGAGIADAIYRPFFKAGIAVVLTLGAAWGALLLLRIGLTGSFAAAGLHEVNAHGHAQIFGWLGLFVMGIAYQAFPRFKQTSLPRPRLALASLWLMASGIALRSLLEPVAAGSAPAAALAMTGSALEIAAVGIFAALIAATWRRSPAPLAPYDFYILSAVAWFAVQTVCDAAYFAATIHAPGREQLLDLVATWQGPLRAVQIYGFALLMVLGVSQRIFPLFYGLPAPGRSVSLAALAGLNLAVVGQVAGVLLMRLGGHAWAALWYASVLLLAGSVCALVFGGGVFSRPAGRDRSLKFFRAAYAWLLVSLGMLVLLPVYQFGLLRWLSPGSEAAGIGFSHAYYGAVRHAVTVGFLSLMIVGVAARVVPALSRADLRSLPALWLPFALINLGCALRVTGQVLTDFTPSAFPVAGVSGLLEVTGLAVWGAHLWRVMSRGRAFEKEAPPGRPVVSLPVLNTR
ncbi:MAG TPA: NnrS family protein [Gemmataceae bacterium]